MSVLIESFAVFRLSINGALSHYTNGTMLDYANRIFRGQLIESGTAIDNVMRGLRRGEQVELKIWLERSAAESVQQSLEFAGLAEVVMIRLRSGRKQLPNFRVAFRLCS